MSVAEVPLIRFTSPAPVLLPIDMQVAFDSPPWGAMDNPDLDANAGRLLAAWRDRGLPVVHVRHDSVQPGSTLAAGASGNRFRAGSEPLDGESVVAKSVNAAFVGTDLDLRLRRMGATELVVYGLQVDMCVSTTVRVGANLGYRITLAEDATAAFDLPVWDGGIVPASVIRAAHLATLNAEFCSVATTHEILLELGATASRAARAA